MPAAVVRALRAAWRLPLVLALAALAAACADLLLAPQTPPRTPHALRLDRRNLTLDDGQHDRLVATVLDQGGAPLDTLPTGLRVRWSSTADSVATVDTAGGVSAGWPGSAGVTATLELAGGPLSIGAAVTVRAVPTRLAVFAGDSQVGTAGVRLAHDLAVRLTDRHGLGVAGDSVTFAISAGGGSLTTALSLTDSTGMASSGLIADTLAGAVTVQARAARLAGVVVPFAARVGPAAAASITAAGGNGQQGIPGDTLPQRLMVRVSDRYGNAVPGAAVAWTVTAGGGSVAAVSAATDSTGRAQAIWTLGASGGAQGVQASAGQLVVAFSATATAGVVTRWDATADFSTTANPNGAWAAGYTATLGSAFTVFPAFANTQLAIWYDPADFTISTPVFGKNVSSSTVFGVAPGQITLHPGCNANEYAELRWTAPSAGSYLASVKLYAGDVGNTDAAVMVNGSSVFATPTTALNPGFSTFRSLAAGDRIAVAVGTGGDGCLNDNTPVTFTVLAMSDVTITANSAGTQTAQAGTAVAAPPSVVVQDVNGNPIAGAVVTFTVTQGGGSLTGATPTTDANGIATVGSWTLGPLAGANSVKAAIDHATSTSFAATGTAPPPAQLAFTVQPGPASSGLAISPAVVVAVQDASGNTVTSAGGSVTLALGGNPGGATLTGTLTQPVVNGVATFGDLVVTGPAASSYTLVASYTGVPSATSAMFSVSAAPPTVSTIDIVGADVVGLGRVTPLLIRLSRPADAGGVTVQVTSDAPGVVGLGTASVSIAAGDSIAYDTLSGVSLGTTTVRAAVGTQTPQALSVQSTDHVLAIQADSLALGGALHTCVIRAGVTYCWGWNGSGQLGDGTTANHATPAVAASGFTFVAITAGSAFTCGLMADGSAWCWGAGSQGQLGNGANVASTTPVPVSGGLTFAKIASGGSGHTCGITTAGALYCWGSLSYYSASFNTPLLIVGTQTWASWAVGGGDCGVTTVGAMLCLGAPARLISVANMPAVTQAAVGNRHICGLDPAGKTWCQGDNTYDELGYVTPIATSTTANPIMGSEVFTSITANYMATCGLTAAGGAFCWGYNIEGELGDSTTTNRLQPLPVAGGHAFAALRMGNETACGVTTAGELWCWGLNNLGQVGDGTTTNRLVPVKVF